MREIEPSEVPYEVFFHWLLRMLPLRPQNTQNNRHLSTALTLLEYRN